nr:MAG TPA: hypothetical protein [Caudoviricetes sp.]
MHTHGAATTGESDTRLRGGMWCVRRHMRAARAVCAI